MRENVRYCVSVGEKVGFCVIFLMFLCEVKKAHSEAYVWVYVMR